MGAGDIKRALGAERFNSYFKFSVIRNPYDQMVSAYYWEKSTKDFKTFCKQHVIRNSNMDRLLLEGRPVCDYYIRYEHLLDDIRAVLKILGITDFNLEDLPKHKGGIRPARDYREYYDEETIAIVYNLYKQEFEMFDYKFGGPEN